MKWWFCLWLYLFFSSSSGSSSDIWSSFRMNMRKMVRTVRLNPTGIAVARTHAYKLPRKHNWLIHRIKCEFYILESNRISKSSFCQLINLLVWIIANPIKTPGNGLFGTCNNSDIFQRLPITIGWCLRSNEIQSNQNAVNKFNWAKHIEHTHLFNDMHVRSAFDNFSKNRVFAIEPWRLHCRNVKLTSIFIWSFVGHSKKAWPSVIYRQIFIFKIFSINARCTSAIVRHNITT